MIDAKLALLGFACAFFINCSSSQEKSTSATAVEPSTDSADIKLLAAFDDDACNEAAALKAFREGANVNARGQNLETALMKSLQACGVGAYNLEVAKILIGRRADVNARSANNYTALMAAAKYSRPEVVAYLLENNADVNARTLNGNSVLMIAIQNSSDLHSYPVIVRLLMSRSPNVIVKNDDEKTALHYAVEKKTADRYC